MKLMKYMLPFAILAMTSSSFLCADDNDSDHCDPGDESQYEQSLDERDWDVLYDYLNTKRTINVKEKSSNLTISGDVRASWRSRFETLDDVKLRGGDIVVEDENGIEILRTDRRSGHNDYDVAFNLKFDYVCKNVWAAVHTQFDNSAGVCNNHNCVDDPQGLHGSGSGCDVDLKKAYFGYNMFCSDASRLDIEVGRRRLYQVFDSQVQYLSRFDGILLKYNFRSDDLGDYYLKAATFVVDYKVDHYAWIAQTGVNNIKGCGVDLGYSIVDWRKHGYNRCGIKDANGSKFLNSQFTANYNFTLGYICKPTRIFAGYVINHDPATTYKTIEEGDDAGTLKKLDKANHAWYLGLEVGEVIFAGDWGFSAQYQWVEAKSVPDDDSSGIGNGNGYRRSFTQSNEGNTNFKGWRGRVLYAFLDNLTFELKAETSCVIDKEYSPSHDYSLVKFEGVYAF